MKYRIRKSQEYNGQTWYYPEKKSKWWPFWVTLHEDIVNGAESHLQEKQAEYSIKMDKNYVSRPKDSFKEIL